MSNDDIHILLNLSRFEKLRQLQSKWLVNVYRMVWGYLVKDKL